MAPSCILEGMLLLYFQTLKILSWQTRLTVAKRARLMELLGVVEEEEPQGEELSEGSSGSFSFPMMC